MENMNSRVVQKVFSFTQKEEPQWYIFLMTTHNHFLQNEEN